MCPESPGGTIVIDRLCSLSGWHHPLKEVPPIGGSNSVFGEEGMITVFRDLQFGFYLRFPGVSALFESGY
jgi:hypothetical protein